MNTNPFDKATTPPNPKPKKWLWVGTSVKWAAKEIIMPEDYHASFFAWGETSTKEKYVEGNSKTYGNENLTNIAGNPAYDAARAIWGGKWRMPTKEEYEELIAKCEWTSAGLYTEAKARNGNVLRIYQCGASHDYTNRYGCYWSATARDSQSAWYLHIGSGNKRMFSTLRSNGLAIIPVLD